MIATSDVERWLREDIGHHDVTNHVRGETEGRLVAKEPGVIAGLDAATAVFEYLGVDIETSIQNGDHVEAGDIVLRTDGSARETLRGERVAVNLVGHAAGIATKTREAVRAARDVDDSVRIACTRKTTPGLRGIEKRAVNAGDGDTHRLDLSHMVMVKENHIAELGLVGAVEHFRDLVSFTTKIEVEVERPEDAPRAAAVGADIVLMDNMDPAATKRAVDLLRETEHGGLVEASGGITIEDVPNYAATGVDVISMGSLTHSADMLDLSFRID
ncbi:carboxylating nicotinate-nucleotide diphosphorylase [Halanaeroarchaeum sulfurireducens]|uniref:Nicotinate-nucleotide pyrophosphorylase [carboxylating] n=1 Tax=Halanaeroarchaeum sulfurireducens TaxID=1604004 RepID=A0A0F7P8M8_9EURY|nr:carboxylating nicotinate-nucleotide diphosphorylase [Halanaeroarchaeum sulfurireducens]AKH97521.1 nicotinate-nucleotide pyrophosphorylase [Halanaeroarchaeum sulfurireducens]ALG81917.1 nicotinate-nucleotide pyrophosphorylase [Halanaeroarchaeum sulfurireducens]